MVRFPITRRVRWTACGLVLALAAALVQMPASAAWAGVLSGVWHAPYGFDELYGATPTERSPRDPMAGQAVELKVTTWPISPGQTVWITWTKNSAGQTPIGAAWDYNSGNNTYWKLNMGSF